MAALKTREPQPWVSRLGKLQVTLGITAEIYTFTDSLFTEEVQREIDGILADISVICVENLMFQDDQIE